MQSETLQQRVDVWMDACFGEAIKSDQLERADRFIEEALELAQTEPSFTADRAHALVDYVFGRDVGDPWQEVGGVMITLAALCNTIAVDIDAAAETELARIWAKVDQIRAKQAGKPTGSALPVAPAPPAESAGPPYASDNWDIQGYKSPAEEIDDMANVGRSLIEHIASVVSSDGPFKGWTPADDPAEIVSDMANWIAENRPSDWFAGDVDADGNELVTLPAHHIAAQDAEIARLREVLGEAREEVLWCAYHTGHVKDGRWTHMFMSDGEGLAADCGFDPRQADYDDAAIRAAIPVAARAALTPEAGHD